MGCVDVKRWQLFSEKREQVETEQQRLQKLWIQPGTEVAKQFEAKYNTPLEHEYNAFELLRRPEVTYDDLIALEGFGSALADRQASQQVEINASYKGYIERQQKEVERLQRNEKTAIPSHMDYDRVRGLSNEVRQKLKEIKPVSIAQASRISGVTPCLYFIVISAFEVESYIRSTTSTQT